MKITFVQIWHGERMGYIDNFLPRAMARLGHEVHLVTSDLQPNSNHPDYDEMYAPYFGPARVPCGVRTGPDGVVLHRLPHGTCRGRLRIRGLYGKLAALRPDVVQGFEVLCGTTLEAALYRLRLGYRLFLEAHVHASVFPPARGWVPPRVRLAWAAHRATTGRLVSALTERCYPISADAAEIAVRFCGISPRKIRIAPLGTDTELFRPARNAAELAAREALRRALGLTAADIVCIYTGRLTPEKGPELLAAAIGQLAAAGASPFRGLFVGDGPRELVEHIRRTPNCRVYPFVPVEELPPLYRCADVAVWPRQESTSQLDAAACGLPLVLNHTVRVRERIDGNGRLYREGDPADLARALLTLRDPAVRRRMGETGRRRMVTQLDWRHLAEQRLADYEAALSAN